MVDRVTKAAVIITHYWITRSSHVELAAFIIQATANGRVVSTVNANRFHADKLVIYRVTLALLAPMLGFFFGFRISRRRADRCFRDGQLIDESPCRMRRSLRLLLLLLLLVVFSGALTTLHLATRIALDCRRPVSAMHLCIQSRCYRPRQLITSISCR